MQRKSEMEQRRRRVLYLVVDRVIRQGGKEGDRRQRLKEMVSNRYYGGFGREPAGDESVHHRDFGVSGMHLPRLA